MKQIKEFFKQHWGLFLVVTIMNLAIALNFMSFLQKGIWVSIFIISVINVGATLLIAEAIKKWKGGKK